MSRGLQGWLIWGIYHFCTTHSSDIKLLVLVAFAFVWKTGAERGLITGLTNAA